MSQKEQQEATLFEKVQTFFNDIGADNKETLSQHDVIKADFKEYTTSDRDYTQGIIYCDGDNHQRCISSIITNIDDNTRKPDICFYYTTKGKGFDLCQTCYDNLEDIILVKSE